MRCSRQRCAIVDFLSRLNQAFLTGFGYSPQISKKSAPRHSWNRRQGYVYLRLRPSAVMPAMRQKPPRAPQQNRIAFAIAASGTCRKPDYFNWQTMLSAGTPGFTFPSRVEGVDA
jgi:hypothetical protein